MITISFASKTHQQIVVDVTGFTAGFDRVDVQYADRPDFRFCLAPLVQNVAPVAGQVTIDRLNQRTSYFVRMRERDGAAVGEWTSALAVATPSNTMPDLSSATVLKIPAMIVLPEYVTAWTADNAHAGHPASNLASDSPVEQWWSDYATPGFAFEMVTAGAPIDTFALLETNAPPAATIAVKGGSSYANVRGGAPAFSTGALSFHASPSLGGRPGYHALVRLAAPQTFTHWRVEIGGNAPLGRFVATYACCGLARVTKNMTDDAGETPVDQGSVARGRDGSPDRQPGYSRGRKVEFDISMMTEAQYEAQISGMRSALGLNMPALVVPNPKPGAFLHDRILYGPISQQKISNPRAPRFTASLSVDSLI